MADQSFTSVLSQSRASRRSEDDRRAEFADSPRKPKQKVDVWTRLYQQEADKRSKYYESPRNLIVMLEHEKDKYHQLEVEYKRFAKEAQREREKLSQEIKLLQEDSTGDIQQLQKALLLKQEDYLKVQRELEDSKLRYDEDVTLLRSDKEKLGVEIEKLRRSVQEYELKQKEQKLFVGKVLNERKKAQEQLELSINQQKKQAAAIEEKETLWLREKELRMQQDVHIIQLEHTINQRGEEIKDLRNQLARNGGELAEMAKFRKLSEELESKIIAQQEEVSKFREQANHHANRERLFQQQKNEWEQQERRYLQDVQRLQHQEHQRQLEIEDYQIQLKDSCAAIEQWKEKYQLLSTRAEELSLQLSKSEHEVHSKEKHIQLLKHEQSLIEAQVKDREELIKQAKHLNTESQQKWKQEAQSKYEIEQRLRAQNDRLQEELDYAHQMLSKLKSHLQAQEDGEMQMRDEMTKQSQLLKDQQQRIEDLQIALKDEMTHSKLLNDQFQVELEQKQQLHRSYKNKMQMVQEKLDWFQNSLEETQKQLNQVQEAETQQRTNLRLKDEQLRQAQRETLQLKSQLENQQTLVEDSQQRQKEEFQSLQDKFQLSKHAYEQEITGLRDLLDKKSQQVSQLKEQLSQRQVIMSELQESKIRLESELDQVKTNPQQSDAKQSQLISQLKTKILELEDAHELLKMKYNTSQDLCKRMEVELETLRTLHRPDKMINHHQQTLQVSRKLKEQVQQLLNERENRMKQISSPNTSFFTNKEPADFSFDEFRIESRSNSKPASRPYILTQEDFNNLTLESSPLKETDLTPLKE